LWFDKLTTNGQLPALSITPLQFAVPPSPTFPPDAGGFALRGDHNPAPRLRGFLPGISTDVPREDDRA
jgi:hypothetical protein